MKETLKVDGMSCNHCVNTIETNVGALPGVSSVKVNLSEKEVAVEFDNTATLTQIKETIDDQGFDLI